MASCSLLLLLLSHLIHFYLLIDLGSGENHDQTKRQQQQQQLKSVIAQLRDPRWPNRKLNVLLDLKSLNSSEQQILEALFDQIEHKTCIEINRLQADLINPFDANSKYLKKSEQNFVYIFKSNFGSYNRSPSIGLSSFGCLKQGRQSLILTDLAFRFPELILRYHVLRSLGVESVERPDGEVRKLLNILPLSQKISDEPESMRHPLMSTTTYFTYASNVLASSAAAPASGETKLANSKSARASDSKTTTTTITTEQNNSKKNNNGKHAQQSADDDHVAVEVKLVQYLSEHDLERIKQLYKCAEFQNKLSLKPLKEINHQDGLQSQNLGSDESLETDPTTTATTTISDQQQQPTQMSDSSLYMFGNDELKQQQDKVNELDRVSNLEQPAQFVHHHEQNLGQFEQKKLGKAELAIKEIIKEAEEAEKAKGGGLNNSSNNNGSQVNDSIISEAAKTIVEYLLNENNNNNSDNVNETTKELESNSKGADSDNDRVDNIFSASELAKSELSDSETTCQPMESCLIPGSQERTSQQNSTKPPLIEEQRPMLLKLDEFHAQDPQLQQANQMKLSQPPNRNINLMNSADFPYQLQQQHQQQQQFSGDRPSAGGNTNTSPAKSEMLLSFEQSDSQSNNPIAALASSKVLKLCSCTCQTMTPFVAPTQPAIPTQPTLPSLPTMPTLTTPSYSIPTTPYPSQDPYNQNSPRTPDWNETSSWMTTTSTSSPSTAIVTQPSIVIEPQTSPRTTATNTTTELPPLSTTPISSSTDRLSSTPTPSPPPTMTTTMSTTLNITTTTLSTPTEFDNSTSTATPPTNNATNKMPLLSDNACELVQWVRPNKTVYSSAKIVWDVDRANQNYFLCNNLVNNEIVPGKTHGFSCKVSNEGKAYELHNFNVLIKPEHVNLAWIQKNSDSFGTTNLPVIGGFSKNQDPYIVSRCMVRDENNDLITLIGYINNQGIGWFPFDDIQIECANYDVLACVN